MFVLSTSCIIKMIMYGITFSLPGFLILEFINLLFKLYVFYTQVDSSHLYQVSLSLLQSYSRCSASRYENNTFMEEEQCEDLLLCLKLLTNLTAKEFLDFSEPCKK